MISLGITLSYEHYDCHLFSSSPYNRLDSWNLLFCESLLNVRENYWQNFNIIIKIIKSLGNLKLVMVKLILVVSVLSSFYQRKWFVIKFILNTDLN